jgi:nucleoside-diphosphate-sugar epimerase
MKKILITGGGGYVGSALVPFLITKGFHVVVIDWFLYKPNLFDEFNENQITKIIGDIRDINVIKKGLENVNYVIHLACISNDPSAELNPNLSLDINQNAFEVLLNECKKIKIEKFIFASSSSIYGISDSPQVYEDHPKVPVSLYNITKAWCEDLLFKKYQDIPFVIVRPATICGYADRIRLDLAVNLLSAHGIINKKINVFGGEQYRPNLHIKDMINLYFFLIEADINIILHQVYNASYKNLTISEISQGIVDTLKTSIGKIEINHTPSNDPRSYRVNTDKLSSLGFVPSFTISDATNELLYAFKKNLISSNLSDPIYNNVNMMKTRKIT